MFKLYATISKAQDQARCITCGLPVDDANDDTCNDCHKNYSMLNADTVSVDDDEAPCIYCGEPTDADLFYGKCYECHMEYMDPYDKADYFASFMINDD